MWWERAAMGRTEPFLAAESMQAKNRGVRVFWGQFFGSELWLAISRAGLVWVVAASRNVLGLSDLS